MRNRSFDWTTYSWVPLVVLGLGLGLYRYGEDFFGQPAMKPFGLYEVTISPPQYVLVCQQEVFINQILTAPSEAARKNTFARMLVPGLSGSPRCDYLGQNGQHVPVSGPLSLTFVREAFVLPADPSLDKYEGAELSGRIYMMMISGQPYFMLLAHPKIDGEYQEWAIDYLTLSYGE